MLNSVISKAAMEAYPDTPVSLNEMINKEEVSSPIRTARKALIKDILSNVELENLGYPNDKYPPQKTMYRSLLLDTGMHAKNWTREQAIQYSLDNEAEGEASIISEIERYMANPGQALSYKVGQLKILELRAKAEKALGENFNIAKFHNQVLETGSVPLAVLEDKINNWIATSKS